MSHIENGHHLDAEIVINEVAVPQEDHDGFLFGFLEGCPTVLRRRILFGFVLAVRSGIGRFALGESGFEFALETHGQAVFGPGRLEIIDDFLA